MVLVGNDSIVVQSGWRTEAGEHLLCFQLPSKINSWEFSGSPVVRTPRFHCRGHSWGTKIPKAMWHGQKK